MIKIGLTGAPGSGKTTLAQHLTSYLRVVNHQKVEYIDEYARFFVSTFGDTNLSEQYLILQKQLIKEKEHNNADIVVTDSPVFLGLIYCYLNINMSSKKERYLLSQIYAEVLEQIQSYDYVFYLKPRLNKNLNDGKRIHTEISLITHIDELIISFYKLHKINYILIDSDNLNLEQSVKYIENTINERK